METELQLKLKEWSKETVEFYLSEVKKVGEEVAVSFYNQSDLSRVKDCDIMIIGINPGMGCSYSNWNKKNAITHDFLYYGNPCFKGMSDNEIIEEMSGKYDPDKRRHGWDIWIKMNKILNVTGKGDLLKRLDKFVLTNMIFFGTSKEKHIPKGIDTIKCAKQTLKLIGILKPKVIVLLGKECRNIFNKVTNCVQMEKLTPDNAVFYCYHNNCHVISIYHTAYYRYHNKDINKTIIGNLIGYALDNPSKRIDKEIFL